MQSLNPATSSYLLRHYYPSSNHLLSLGPLQSLPLQFPHWPLSPSLLPTLSQTMSLLCSEPRAGSCLRVKAEAVTTALQTFKELSLPLSLRDLTFYLLPPGFLYSSPTGLLPALKCIRFSLTSGPLHWLFLLPPYHTACSLTSFTSQQKHHLLQEALP